MASRKQSGGARRLQRRAGGMTFSIQMDPSPAQIADMFEELREQITDLSAVWPELATKLRAGLAQNLDQQGRPLGVTWPDLAPGYAKRKAAAGFPRRLLFRTGALLRHIQNAEVVSQGKAFMRLGFATPDYEQDINYGTRKNQGKNGGKLPARQYMGISPTMRRDIVSAIENHVARVLDDAGKTLDRAPKVAVL